jgi:beta-galactosidase/beta-glucuronidase
VLKSLGFDSLRKHQKIESRRFYYHCDRLGLAVIQDFPGVCLTASASIARLLCDSVWGGGLLQLPFLLPSLGRVRH